MRSSVARSIAMGLLLTVPLLANSAAHRLDLPMRVQQGALVIGHAEANASVQFDGRALHVGEDGTFVFGVGRDAPAKAQISVEYADHSKRSASLGVIKREYHIERVDGLPQHTVTPDPELSARIEREQAAIAEARKRDDEREDFLGGFELPIHGRISGVYGSQRIDNGTPKSAHMGLDVAAIEGTPIHAPAPGIVIFAATDLVLTGGTVLIDHGFGLSSSFLHMSKLDVKAGDRIERGQVIGKVGKTGRASGPHMHWGFNWFEQRLDPALLPGVQLK